MDFSVTDALLRGLMLFLFVFLVLALLCGIITIFSRIIGAIENAGKKKNAAPAASASAETPAAQASEENSDGPWGGKLKLKEVDEQTAAMIMAIVSDESGIPLSELVFKSISLVESKQDAKEEA